MRYLQVFAPHAVLLLAVLIRLCTGRFRGLDRLLLRVFGKRKTPIALLVSAMAYRRIDHVRSLALFSELANSGSESFAMVGSVNEVLGTRRREPPYPN